MDFYPERKKFLTYNSFSVPSTFPPALGYPVNEFLEVGANELASKSLTHNMVSGSVVNDAKLLTFMNPSCDLTEKSETLQGLSVSKCGLPPLTVYRYSNNNNGYSFHKSYLKHIPNCHSSSTLGQVSSTRLLSQCDYKKPTNTLINQKSDILSCFMEEPLVYREKGFFQNNEEWGNFQCKSSHSQFRKHIAFSEKKENASFAVGDKIKDVMPETLLKFEETKSTNVPLFKETENLSKMVSQHKEQLDNFSLSPKYSALLTTPNNSLPCSETTKKSDVLCIDDCTSSKLAKYTQIKFMSADIDKPDSPGKFKDSLFLQCNFDTLETLETSISLDEVSSDIALTPQHFEKTKKFATVKDEDEALSNAKCNFLQNKSSVMELDEPKKSREFNTEPQNREKINYNITGKHKMPDMSFNNEFNSKVVFIPVLLQNDQANSVSESYYKENVMNSDALVSREIVSSIYKLRNNDESLGSMIFHYPEISLQRRHTKNNVGDIDNGSKKTTKKFNDCNTNCVKLENIDYKTLAKDNWEVKRKENSNFKFQSPLTILPSFNLESCLAHKKKKILLKSKYMPPLKVKRKSQSSYTLSQAEYIRPKYSESHQTIPHFALHNEELLFSQKKIDTEIIGKDSCNYLKDKQFSCSQILSDSSILGKNIGFNNKTTKERFLKNTLPLKKCSEFLDSIIIAKIGRQGYNNKNCLTKDNYGKKLAELNQMETKKSMTVIKKMFTNKITDGKLNGVDIKKEKQEKYNFNNSIKLKFSDLSHDNPSFKSKKLVKKQNKFAGKGKEILAYDVATFENVSINEKRKNSSLKSNNGGNLLRNKGIVHKCEAIRNINSKTKECEIFSKSAISCINENNLTSSSGVGAKIKIIKKKVEMSKESILTNNASIFTDTVIVAPKKSNAVKNSFQKSGSKILKDSREKNNKSKNSVFFSLKNCFLNNVNHKKAEKDLSKIIINIGSLREVYLDDANIVKRTLFCVVYEQGEDPAHMVRNLRFRTPKRQAIFNPNTKSICCVFDHQTVIPYNEDAAGLRVTVMQIVHHIYDLNENTAVETPALTELGTSPLLIIQNKEFMLTKYWALINTANPGDSTGELEITTEISNSNDINFSENSIVR